MNNRIVLLSNENDGKGLIVRKLDEMNNGDLFQFMHEHKFARVSYLMSDTDIDQYIRDVKELSLFDIYDKELSGDEHIKVGKLINKTTEATWSVVPLEDVIYKLVRFIK